MREEREPGPQQLDEHEERVRFVRRSADSQLVFGLRLDLQHQTFEAALRLVAPLAELLGDEQRDAVNLATVEILLRGEEQLGRTVVVAFLRRDVPVITHLALGRTAAELDPQEVVGACFQLEHVASAFAGTGGVDAEVADVHLVFLAERDDLLRDLQRRRVDLVSGVLIDILLSHDPHGVLTPLVDADIGDGHHRLVTARGERKVAARRSCGVGEVGHHAILARQRPCLDEIRLGVERLAAVRVEEHGAVETHELAGLPGCFPVHAEDVQRFVDLLLCGEVGERAVRILDGRVGDDVRRILGVEADEQAVDPRAPLHVDLHVDGVPAVARLREHPERVEPRRRVGHADHLEVRVLRQVTRGGGLDVGSNVRQLVRDEHHIFRLLTDELPDLVLRRRLVGSHQHDPGEVGLLALLINIPDHAPRVGQLAWCQLVNGSEQLRDGPPDTATGTLQIR